MREILFRGQTRKKGEKVRVGDGKPVEGNWVYGGILQGSGDFSIIYTGSEVSDFEKLSVYSDTVGQYTGKDDQKSGAKVFEGDICRISIDGKTVEENPFVIKWNNGNSEFEAENKNESIGLGYVNVVEVIGNIYDNPKLMEEK